MNALEPLGVVFRPSEAGWDCHAVAAPIAWRDDAGYHMLYQGWREKSGPRLLGLAESDNGLRWQRSQEDPVMVPTPGTWDENGFEAGCLIQDGSEYHLYYSGAGPDVKWRMGVASSHDLRTWQKHSANPVLEVGTAGAWDENAVAFPAVHKRLHPGPARWRMTYGGYGTRSMQIGTAFSVDGLAWQKHPSPTHPQRGWFADPDCETWDAGIEVHHMFARGDWYVMLYEGLGAPGRYSLGAAFSPDAVVWARSPRNPLWPLSTCAVNQQLSSVHPFLLQSDRVLYYVEVLQASAEAPHRICAARLKDESLIDPTMQARLDFRLWSSERVGADGKATAAIPTAGYSRASFAALPSSHGRLQIELDFAGLDEWHVVESAELSADTLFRGFIAGLTGSVRLRFIPDGPAACSAWLSLHR